MRAAFKEWAIVVDALGRGDQIIILRKGGISEDKGGFAMEHNRFLLFPTLYHQQREQVIPSAQARYDEIAPMLPDASSVRIEFAADVVQHFNIQDLDTAQSLKGQHIWRDEVIAERFDWGRGKNIFAIAVRVMRLATPVSLPVIPTYAGCKSWIELEQDFPESGLQPVLSDVSFLQKIREFSNILELHGKGSAI